MSRQSVQRGRSANCQGATAARRDRLESASEPNPASSSNFAPRIVRLAHSHIFAKSNSQVNPGLTFPPINHALAICLDDPIGK